MTSGIVLAVSRNNVHGFTKLPQSFIQLIAGEGVEGDAHRGATTQHLYLKRKDPQRTNLCQVHLFAAEMLDELATRGFALGPGQIGENILTRGIDLLALPRGTKLLLGDEAVVEVTGLRTPCSQIDGYRKGLQRHLWGPSKTNGMRVRRAGVMSTVLVGGLVRAGDIVRVVLPPTPHMALGPV